MAIRRRGNNWVYDIYDSNNKRLRGIVKIEGIANEAVTRKQALDYEKVLKGKLAEGVRLGSNKKDILFDKLVKEYLNWCDTNHIRNDRDHSVCKNLLNYFSGYKASKITLWSIERYKKQRKELGREPRTINIELAGLRHMYNKAIEWKLISENPITGIKLLKQETKEIRVINEVEFQKLYDNSNESFRPALLFAYFTGCRSSEIRNLQWKNVNLSDGSVLITNTKNKEERVVYLNDNLKYELKRIFQPDTKFVFNYKKIPSFNKTTFRKCWLYALKKSGIKHCVFHDLRHTFCSNMIVNVGVDFETVMSLTGHKSLSMLKRYTHTNKNAKKEAVKKLENHLKLPIYSHNLVTKTINEKLEESKVVHLSTLNH